MNYEEAIAYLYSLQLFGIRLGLETPRRLAQRSGNPEQKLKFIHVAGTNGKGSTCAILESIYRRSRLKVGLFTSPHLVSFRERIQIDREWIDASSVARLATDLKAIVESEPADSDGRPFAPTFFEAVTWMASVYFAEQRCDLVIWETGLGGRLDATNIVTPLASVITNIQLDHQKWLGETLEKIAGEKAGIIKSEVPIITSVLPGPARQVICQRANELAAPLFGVDQPGGFRAGELSLRGPAQQWNSALALKVVEVLQGSLPVSAEAIAEGLRRVHWAGRFQIVRKEGRTIVLDGAHNRDGVLNLLATWEEEFPGEKPALVLGILNDKDWPAMCQLLAGLPKEVHLSQVNNERTSRPEDLARVFREGGATAAIHLHACASSALSAVRNERLVLVTGSIFFIGEAMEILGLERGLAGERQLTESHAERPSM
jgi:dihydrofolate synthase/folylpolyglutamate synthase